MEPAGGRATPTGRAGGHNGNKRNNDEPHQRRHGALLSVAPYDDVRAETGLVGCLPCDSGADCKVHEGKHLYERGEKQGKYGKNDVPIGTIRVCDEPEHDRPTEQNSVGDDEANKYAWHGTYYAVTTRDLVLIRSGICGSFSGLPC